MCVCLTHSFTFCPEEKKKINVNPQEKKNSFNIIYLISLLAWQESRMLWVCWCWPPLTTFKCILLELSRWNPGVGRVGNKAKQKPYSTIPTIKIKTARSGERMLSILACRQICLPGKEASWRNCHHVFDFAHSCALQGPGSHLLVSLYWPSTSVPCGSHWEAPSIKIPPVH